MDSFDLKTVKRDLFRCDWHFFVHCLAGGCKKHKIAQVFAAIPRVVSQIVGTPRKLVAAIALG